MRDRGPWFVADGPHRMVRTRLTSAAVAIGFAFLAGGCASSRRPPRVEAPPMPLRMGAVEEGLASWYGEPYHGRPTASGPRYDMWAMTAAHRTLPFGTVVRVRNTDSGREADVTINDRGPFVAGRILDLSRAAAEKLGAVGPGVIPVRIEVRRLGDGMPNEPCWEVQVGAFAREENARRAGSNLEAKGYAVRFAPAGGGLTRVRATALAGRQKAIEAAATLAGEYPGAVAVPCGGGW
ncbi:MAG: septal ring lytic transglycosylase RlpA family protein [Acidobacteriia bacterium]|nr:septal ring lytic transglycosylase RlpA family protein [Terriglobia bacterium]